jgi:hypothetical protein
MEMIKNIMLVVGGYFLWYVAWRIASQAVFKSYFEERRRSHGSNWPEGLAKWKVSEAEHLLDLLPFIAGKFLHRSKIQKNVKRGDVEYVIDLMVHQGLGAGRANCICINQLFDDRCAPCEILYQLWAKEKLSEEEEKLLESVKTKRRTVYLLRCLDNAKEMSKGKQVWEVAHWNFQRHIDELATLPKGGGHVIFTDVDEGQSVAFKRQGTRQDNTQYLGHKFVPREPLPDEIIYYGEPEDKKLMPLDTLIHVPTFEEVFKTFFGFDYDGQAITIELALQGEGKPAKEKKETPPEEEPEVEEDKKEKPKLAMPGSDDSEEQTEEQTEEQETKEEVPDLECPAEGTFGVDLDKLPECGPCKLWDKCADKAEALASE